MDKSKSELKLTPTQRRFYELLSDGKPHRKEELHALLWDELSGDTAVAFHMCLLRKKLVDLEQTVYAENDTYRLVAFLD